MSTPLTPEQLQSDDWLKSLQRFIDGKFTLCVPAQRTDDDLVISDAIAQRDATIRALAADLMEAYRDKPTWEVSAVGQKWIKWAKEDEESQKTPTGFWACPQCKNPTVAKGQYCSAECAKAAAEPKEEPAPGPRCGRCKQVKPDVSFAEEVGINCCDDCFRAFEDGEW